MISKVVPPGKITNASAQIAPLGSSVSSLTRAASGSGTEGTSPDAKHWLGGREAGRGREGGGV